MCRFRMPGRGSALVPTEAESKTFVDAGSDYLAKPEYALSSDMDLVGVNSSLVLMRLVAALDMAGSFFVSAVVSSCVLIVLAIISNG